MHWHWRLILAVALVQGCAARTTRSVAEPQSGYLITGQGITYFGLIPGDTAPEMTTIGPPDAVQTAAARDARRMGFAPICSRFFSASEAIIVIFETRCDSRLNVDDGQGMGAYSGDGRALAAPLLEVRTEFTALVPFRRSAR